MIIIWYKTYIFWQIDIKIVTFAGRYYNPFITSLVQANKKLQIINHTSSRRLGTNRELQLFSEDVVFGVPKRWSDDGGGACVHTFTDSGFDGGGVCCGDCLTCRWFLQSPCHWIFLCSFLCFNSYHSCSRYTMHCLDMQ